MARTVDTTATVKRGQTQQQNNGATEQQRTAARKSDFDQERMPQHKAWKRRKPTGQNCEDVEKWPSNSKSNICQR